MFLGYYMFLHSQTIKEENLRTHIVILTENTDTGTSDTGKIPLPKIWLVAPWNATLSSSMIELVLPITKYVVAQLEVGPKFAFNSEDR